MATNLTAEGGRGPGRATPEQFAAAGHHVSEVRACDRIRQQRRPEAAIHQGRAASHEAAP